MSMGYRGLVSDWLWIRSVLYYGRRVADEDNPYYVYALEKGSVEALRGGRPSTFSTPDSVFLRDESIKRVLYGFNSQGMVDDIYPLLDRVTTLDPHFLFPYIFGGVYVLMDTGEIDAALELLSKGYGANPNRWEFPFYLGWVEWMYRGNLRKTHEYLLEAVDREGCPEYVGVLLVGLSKKIGSAQLTKFYLEGLLESTGNPAIRERLGAILQQLPGSSAGI